MVTLPHRARSAVNVKTPSGRSYKGAGGGDLKDRPAYCKTHPVHTLGAMVQTVNQRQQACVVLISSAAVFILLRWRSGPHDPDLWPLSFLRRQRLSQTHRHFKSASHGWRTPSAPTHTHTHPPTQWYCPELNSVRCGVKGYWFNLIWHLFYCVGSFCVSTVE